MAISYTGKECARPTGVGRLAGVFSNGKVQCTTRALRRQAGLDTLIAVLKAKRGQTGAGECVEHHLSLALRPMRLSGVCHAITVCPLHAARARVPITHDTRPALWHWRRQAAPVWRGRN